MELNLDYIAEQSDDQLREALTRIDDNELYSAIEGVLARRQGFDTPVFVPPPMDTGYQQRYDATQNILSGQFIRDIDTQLQEENILPFIRPETTGGFMPMMPMGGSPMSMKNPGYGVERNRRIQETLLSNLSEALAMDESQIDITSGLGDVINRGLLSFQEDPQGKFDFLSDQYGRDNVRQFSIGNKPSFLVKKDGKEVLVDEQGAAFGDILDVIRPGLVLGAEIGASFIPGAVAPRALAKFPIATRGAFASAGALGGELLSEGIESGPIRSESLGEFTEGVEGLQSLQRGGVAGAFDVGFGKAFALGAKVFTPPGVKGTDISQEDFLRVLQRMEQRTGVDITSKTTPSMRAGTRATEVEGEVVSKLEVVGVSDDMQPTVVQNRKAFNSALGAIIKKVKGEEVDFSELSKIGKEHFEALEQAALDSADGARDQAAKATAKYFRDLGESVMAEAGRKTSKELGEDLQRNVQNIFNANKAQVDALYDEALSMGDDIPGVSMLDVARRLLNIDALSKELPIGIDERVIRSFIPKNVLIELSKSRSLSANARARLKQIAEFEANQELFQEGSQKTFMPLLEGISEMADPGEPLTLTFRNLVNAKKQLNQVYGQAARGDYLEKKQLRSMIDSLDGLMEGMAREADSDAFDVLRSANKLWKEKRLPLLEDRNLQSILGNTKSSLSPSGVTDALISKRRDQVQGLVALRNAAPDPEAFSKDVRDSAVNSIFAATENADGQIDLGRLNNMLKNNDLIDEFFDRDTVRGLQRLAGSYSGRSKNLLNLSNDPTVSPETLRKLLAPDAPLSPTDKRVLKGQLNDQRALSNRIKAINANEASVILREGGGNVVDNTNSTVNTLLNLRSASQVKVFMDSLDEAGQEGVRALVRKRIFDSAVPGSDGARMGDQFGGARLPSADSAIFKDLRDTTSTPYEVAKDILGEDGVQDVLDLVTILDRVGRDAQQEASGLLKGTQGQVIGRGGQAQTTFMPRIISTLNLDLPYTKLLGIAMTSENFLNLVGKGKPADITLAILPAIYSSDNAFQVFTQMVSEDPSLIGAIDILTQAVDVQNSDLLR